MIEMFDVNNVREYLSGPIASVRTPFTRKGAIDYDGLKNYLDFIIEEAHSGTVLLTHGDSLYSLLTDREVAELTQFVVDYTDGRAMVVSAERKWWTGKSVEFARYCREIGVDVHMVLPPDWARASTPQTLARHYEKVAQEIPVMIVTNLDKRPVPLTTLEILLEREINIVAIKDDCTGGYARRMMNLIGDRWPVLSGGRMENHLDIYPYGVNAYLAVYISFKPEIAYSYWKCVQNDDIKEAAKYVNTYDIPFLQFADKLDVDFDAQLHASMEIFGVCKRWRRSPYYNFNEGEIDKLKNFYNNLSLIK